MLPEVAAPAAPASAPVETPSPAQPVTSQAAPVAPPPAGASAPTPEPTAAAPAAPAAPTTTPSATEPAPAPEAPAVSPEMQEYVANLERTAADARHKQELEAIGQHAAEFAQKLQTEQGLTPEQAGFLARREAEQTLREVRTAQFRQGQINAAFAIGQKHGVDPRTLMNLPTPQAMEQAAAQAKSQGSVAAD